MINHARTLLMNRTGDHGYSWEFPGEEFVDPTFVPKLLPAWLQGGLRVVFGTNPDRLYLNYRLRQVMTILHSTELEEFVHALDQRITYWPFPDEALFDQVFGITADQASGPTTTLYTGGRHLADDGAGRTELQWGVEVLDGQLVEVIRHTPPIVSDTIPYTVEKGLTSEIVLAGSGLKIRFADTVSGVSWVIRSRARPQTNVAVLLQTMGDTIGSGNIDKLFVPTDEPYRTFRNLWEDSDLFGYRYGALLLGIVYYMDGLPQEA